MLFSLKLSSCQSSTHSPISADCLAHSLSHLSSCLENHIQTHIHIYMRFCYCFYRRDHIVYTFLAFCFSHHIYMLFSPNINNGLFNSCIFHTYKTQLIKLSPCQCACGLISGFYFCFMLLK